MKSSIFLILVSVLVILCAINFNVKAEPRNVRLKKQVKNVNINNEENTNIKFKEKNKFNTQTAQIIVNVPKAKVLRRQRRPTNEEWSIYNAIKNLFNSIKVRSGEDKDTKLLENVIDNLNPKYIATQRIYRLIFSPDYQPFVPKPLPGLAGPIEPLKLETGGLIKVQMDEALDELKQAISWDMGFTEELANSDDKLLTPKEIAMKLLILCLSDDYFCPKPRNAKKRAENKLKKKNVSTILKRDPLAESSSSKVDELVGRAESELNKDDSEIEDEPRMVRPKKKKASTSRATTKVEEPQDSSTIDKLSSMIEGLKQAHLNSKASSSD